jgi:hypothetical protein
LMYASAARKVGSHTDRITSALRVYVDAARRRTANDQL